MTEHEMIRLLERQIETLEAQGVDMRGDRQFFEVGEWLLAFEGVYVANRRRPQALAQSDVVALTEYFGEDMSELDEMAQTAAQ